MRPISHNDIVGMPSQTAYLFGIESGVELCKEAAAMAIDLAEANAAIREIDRSIWPEMQRATPEAAFRSVLSKAIRRSGRGENRISRFRRSDDFYSPAMGGTGGAITDDEVAKLEDKAKTLASDFIAVIKTLKAAGLDVKPLLNQLNALL